MHLMLLRSSDLRRELIWMSGLSQEAISWSRCATLEGPRNRPDRASPKLMPGCNGPLRVRFQDESALRQRRHDDSRLAGGVRDLAHIDVHAGFARAA